MNTCEKGTDNIKLIKDIQVSYQSEKVNDRERKKKKVKLEVVALLKMFLSNTHVSNVLPDS